MLPTLRRWRSAPMRPLPCDTLPRTDRVFLAAFLITPACKTARLFAQKRGQGGHSSTTGLGRWTRHCWRGLGASEADEREAVHWGGESEGSDVALGFGDNADATPAGVESGAAPSQQSRVDRQTARTRRRSYPLKMRGEMLTTISNNGPAHSHRSAEWTSRSA